MDFPSSISLTSQFPILGLLGSIYSNFNRTFCKQTVENQIRRRILRRLIWLSTVWWCPIKRTQGLNGIMGESFLGNNIIFKDKFQVQKMYCIRLPIWSAGSVIWLPFNAKKTLFSLHHSKYLGIQRLRANRIERLSPLHDTRMKTGFKLHWRCYLIFLNNLHITSSTPRSRTTLHLSHDMWFPTM